MIVVIVLKEFVRPIFDVPLGNDKTIPEEPCRWTDSTDLAPNTGD